MYVSHETLLWWRVRGEISKSAKLLWPKKWEGTECRNCCGNLSPGSFPSHIPLLTVSFYITSVTHTQTNIDTHTEKITHTDVFGNQQIYHSTTFSNTISEWSELNPTRTAARNNTKDCLPTGQEQAWTRITRLFGCSFGCHHAENGPMHRKMVIDCPLVITSKVKPFSRPGKTRKEEWLVQTVFCLMLGLVRFTPQKIPMDYAAKSSANPTSEQIFETCFFGVIYLFFLVCIYWNPQPNSFLLHIRNKRVS